MKNKIITATLALGFSLAANNVVAGILLDTSKDTYSVLAGYGQSFPDWGETTQRVETVDLFLRHDHFVFDLFDSNWYQGEYSVFMEFAGHFLPDYSSSMLGMNFLAAYTFTKDSKYQPYIFGGGGPVYSFADVEGMGADWNGNYQAGLGLEIVGDNSILFEVRYHHISNAGAEEPNEPLNSVKLLVGFSF